MTRSRSLEQPLMLYGAPVGLYTGKIRSYLRKQGIPYVERLPSDPVFRKQILPAIGRFINPVIRMPDGLLVQDTADIIDFLEAEGYAAFASTPATPKQKLVALILDLFGGEGLLRPAMHYRWSYRLENEAFLRSEFGLSYRTGRATEAEIGRQLDQFMNYLNAYIPRFGITQASRAVIEASYEDILQRLEGHFRLHPYALGGVPTIADYGLMAPLYAHLARDPVPSTLMKRLAPSVFRWTERMNATDADMPEFPRYAPALADDDSLPETLLPVLEFIASDYLPELQMTVTAVDAWLAQQGSRAVEGKPIERTLCSAHFVLRGQTLETIVQPYTLYKLQRVTDAHAALDAETRQDVAALMGQVGLQSLLTLRASRRVERAQHLEVWGALTR